MEEKWLHRPTWIEVDLDAISHNIQTIRKLVGKDKKIMGIVKADAYGHGAVEVAQVLLKHGVEYLAVSILDEAIALRKGGIIAPILILGYTPVEQVKEIVKWGITQTIYNRDIIYALSKEAQKQKKRVKIHIKVDTGMGRIGFIGKEEIVKAVKEFRQLPYIDIEGIFTHFSVADQKDKRYTFKQLKNFEKVIKALEKEDIYIPIKHTANSAATIDIDQSRFDMVRPGIILYGLYPSDEVRKERLNLKPAMSFKTRIAHIKKVPPNTSISYGRKFITSNESIIATLPVGYADGFSRMLSGKAKVLIQGKKVPVVGAICMDQCMVDISNIPNVEIGDEVIVFGKGLPVEEIAEKLGTINYEVICMLNKRVPRVYKHKGKIIGIKNVLLDS
ncbi:alanine racemase [Garciella nitratireducens]|uniref:alanine racemase n=1 Tax=Garciella nitratireducens TaxID=218205 RepID=UPI000DE8CB2D|nr:alanine racemase [Garciella nitratireducens]RBP44787.1 alanine racemase [Garciella nitratireducens]